MSESLPSKVITTHLFTLLVNNIARTIDITSYLKQEFQNCP